jgi:hypothetical protein
MCEQRFDLDAPTAIGNVNFIGIDLDSDDVYIEHLVTPLRGAHYAIGVLGWAPAPEYSPDAMSRTNRVAVAIATAAASIAAAAIASVVGAAAAADARAAELNAELNAEVVRFKRATAESEGNLRKRRRVPNEYHEASGSEGDDDRYVRLD